MQQMQQMRGKVYEPAYEANALLLQFEGIQFIGLHQHGDHILGTHFARQQSLTGILQWLQLVLQRKEADYWLWEKHLTVGRPTFLAKASKGKCSRSSRGVCPLYTKKSSASKTSPSLSAM